MIPPIPQLINTSYSSIMMISRAFQGRYEGVGLIFAPGAKLFKGLLSLFLSQHLTTFDYRCKSLDRSSSLQIIHIVTTPAKIFILLYSFLCASYSRNNL